MGMEERCQPKSSEELGLKEECQFIRSTQVAGGNIAIEGSHLVPTTPLHYRQLKTGINVYTVSMVKPPGIQKPLNGSRWC